MSQSFGHAAGRQYTRRWDDLPTLPTHRKCHLCTAAKMIDHLEAPEARPAGPGGQGGRWRPSHHGAAAAPVAIGNKRQLTARAVRSAPARGPLRRLAFTRFAIFATVARLLRYEHARRFRVGSSALPIGRRSRPEAERLSRPTRRKRSTGCPAACP